MRKSFGGVKPSKQIAQEMLPTRHDLASIVKGTAAQRTLNNYAKMTPADASGLKNSKLNLFTEG